MTGLPYFCTGLVAMHTLWMRQHNRLARQLAEINPHWNDEQIFQVCLFVFLFVCSPVYLFNILSIMSIVLDCQYR